MPHLAVVDDGDEERGGDVEALDQVGADGGRAAGVGHVQARAGGDDARDPRRRRAEHHRVVRQLGTGDRRLAAGAVLRDLEQVDLVGGEAGLQGGRQLGAELRRGACDRGRAGDAVQRGAGELVALA